MRPSPSPPSSRREASALRPGCLGAQSCFIHLGWGPACQPGAVPTGGRHQGTKGLRTRRVKEHRAVSPHCPPSQGRGRGCDSLEPTRVSTCSYDPQDVFFWWGRMGVALQHLE